MCKKELFKSSGTKNKLFKVHGRKMNFMKNLETKTILLPIKKKFLETFSN